MDRAVKFIMGVAYAGCLLFPLAIIMCVLIPSPKRAKKTKADRPTLKRAVR